MGLTPGEEGEPDSPTEYRRRIKSSAFFREPDFAEALFPAFCPPSHQRNAG
jgi:hypothetical protein